MFPQPAQPPGYPERDALDGKPFRVTMGLRPLDLANWLERDANFAADLDLRRRLLRERRDAVFAVLPGDDVERACREVLNWIEDAIGTSAGLDGHPLERAARQVQEDLCVMVCRDGVWVLGAAVLCFPSRWSLREKLGRSLSDIHEPVPHYAAIGGSIDRLFDRLTADRSLWRMNWTVLDSPELYQPAPPTGETARAITAENAGENLWLRIERQTLRRLTTAEAVLFTIHTYVKRLDALAPEIRRDLLAAVATADGATQRYKGWQKSFDPMVAWLNRVPFENPGCQAARRTNGDGDAVLEGDAV
jgi:hypothetical protein